MANKRTLGEHLGGRMIGICFFLALEFAVVSPLFTFFEITIRTFENKFKLARKKAALIFAVIIGTGNIIVSLGCWMICLFDKILTIGTTFFTALTLKASIGTYACWDVLSVNVSELSGLKIATFCMIMNTLFVLLQILLLRKDFQPYKLLQIPYVIFFSSMVNFFYYQILTFQVNTYPVHLLLFILGPSENLFLSYLAPLSGKLRCKLID